MVPLTNMSRLVVKQTKQQKKSNSLAGFMSVVVVTICIFPQGANHMKNGFQNDLLVGLSLSLSGPQYKCCRLLIMPDSHKPV